VSYETPPTHQFTCQKECVMVTSCDIRHSCNRTAASHIVGDGIFGCISAAANVLRVCVSHDYFCWHITEIGCARARTKAGKRCAFLSPKLAYTKNTTPSHDTQTANSIQHTTHHTRTHVMGVNVYSSGREKCASVFLFLGFSGSEE
jgi:hypothetical protein